MIVVFFIYLFVILDIDKCLFEPPSCVTSDQSGIFDSAPVWLVSMHQLFCMSLNTYVFLHLPYRALRGVQNPVSFDSNEFVYVTKLRIVLEVARERYAIFACDGQVLDIYVPGTICQVSDKFNCFVSCFFILWLQMPQWSSGKVSFCKIISIRRSRLFKMRPRNAFLLCESFLPRLSTFKVHNTNIR